VEASTQQLLDEAYRLSVVEEKHREAIELCRKALKIEPNNYRIQVFLGMLLGDHGTEEEIMEARHYFIAAIENAKTASCFCTTWPEEAAIHHLGAWEWARENYLNAALFFLIDSTLCNNRESARCLNQLLSENDLTMVRELKLIISRILEEQKSANKSPLPTP